MSQKYYAKKCRNVEKQEKIEQRKAIAYQSEEKNNIQNIALAKALKLGYKPLPQDRVVDILREDAKQWLEKLTEEEKRAIRKYTDNRIDLNGKNYLKK